MHSLDAHSSACWSPRSWSTSSTADSSPNSSLSRTEELFEKAKSLPAILENGRKVFGPPLDYVGARPSYKCELYVAKLPKSLDEVRFIAWLFRCGVVYEMRLMMESFDMTRGYAFVRYTQEYEALAAYELLNFVFLNGERLSVYRSQGKNRLYISNIPKQLPLELLESGFKKAFRDMEHCTAHASRADEAAKGELNRGYAFIEFYDHETALEAKKRTTPGRMRMWGNDLKVQWAKPKSIVDNNAGQKKTRSIWQQPSCQNDYCAKLRLFCLANNWCIPLVVYGRCIRQKGVQYGGILLKDSTTGEYSCMLMEVTVEPEIQDVHVAMCEAATQLIEQNNGFPKQHYLLRFLNGCRAEIAFNCANNLDIAAQLVHCMARLVSWSSIYELVTALLVLVQYSSENIVNFYKRSFLVMRPCFTLSRHLLSAQFYSIFPKFRNNQPLNYGFNDTEIILICCETKTDKSYNENFIGKRVMHDLNDTTKPYYLHLKSQRIRNTFGYTLRYIDLTQLEDRQFYHPEQRVNTPPIWITGHSYQKSIFK
ncbi:uncharacterized protein [Eurosta solidaginis]|uniref:uncharacterized protein n=1 Tax=Eurosta solidaginis TaxID=178769 RepID=UPI00353084A3